VTRRALPLALVLLAAAALAGEPVQPHARFVTGTIPGTLRYQVVIEGAGHGEISGVLGELTNLEVLAGPVLAQQVTWRGDQAVAVTALTWVLRARQLGPIAVGPTTVRLGDAEAVTNPVHGTAFAGGHAAVEELRPELRVELSSRRLLVGEPLVVRFFVESPGDVGVEGWEVQASFPESWSERLPLDDVAARDVVPDGIPRVPLGGWLVIPVRAGRLEIPPAVARTVAAPGERESAALPARSVTSRAVGADVNPLPPAPAPFFGAVGEFSFARRLLAGELRAGDLVTLEVEVEGVGNLPLLDPPPLRLPEGLRTFPAEEVHQWQPSSRGLVGWRRWHIPLEASRPGRYELPAVRLCSFRPGASYTTHTLPALELVVGPASAPPPEAAVAAHKPSAGDALPWPALLAAAFVLGVACAAAAITWRARRRAVPLPPAPGAAPAQELRDLQIAVESWARSRFGVTVAEGADRLAAAGCPAVEATEAVALVEACERLRFAPSLADPADALANLRLRVARLVATTPQRTDKLKE
jgi:hypothetical protein